ncbi:MAG: L-fuculokinase [Sphaerochaetaceae bacterium]
MSLVGVDIGSSRCKAAIYSLDGSLIASSVASYSVEHREPGCFELDCQAVENAVYAVIRTAADRSRWPQKHIHDQIRGITFSSFGEAVVPISSKGEILGPSIFSHDERRKDALRNFEQLGQERFFRINGNILGYSYSYPKLVWYQENAPALYGNVWKFLLWADFMVYRLTGIATTNYSLASRTLLFDLWKEQWSDELLEAGHVDKRTLADLVAPGIALGTIKHDMASRLGLPDTTMVASALHDQAANAVGAGALDGGSSVTGIGTVECTTVVFDHIPDPAYLLDLNIGIEHHVVPGRYVSFIYNQAGALMTWFLKTFCGELLAQGMEESRIFELLRSEAPPAPGSTVFLPFIEPGGAPSFLEAQNGCFLGIGATTSRGALYRAVLEGQTMYFLDAFRRLADKGLGIQALTATGGGNRDDLWLQIKADILQLGVRRARYQEAGTAGAAIVAGVACGDYSSYQQAASNFKGTGTEISPQADHRNTYGNLYRLYQAGMELIQSDPWTDIKHKINQEKEGIV